MKKLAAVSDSAELFVLKEEETKVHFDDGALVNIRNSSSKGSAIRLIRNGKIGLSCSNRPGEIAPLLKYIDATLPFSGKADFGFAPQADYSTLNCFDDRIASLSSESMVKAGKDLVEKLKSLSDKMQIILYLVKNITTVSVYTTAGFKGEFSQASYWLSFEGKLMDEGNFIVLEDTTGGHSLDDFHPGSVFEKAKKDFELCKHNVSLKTGTYDIIFSPDIFVDLARPILATVNGRNIMEKTSALTDKQGSQIVDPRVSIMDNPTIPFKPGSVPFDDEGIPSLKKNIIKDGVLSSFLYDLKSATALGATPQGNAFRSVPLLGGRSYAANPCPEGTNIIMSPGQSSINDIISDIKDGVYLRLLMGTMLGNHVTGVLAGNLWLGYKIENGELIGRVKDSMITFNVYEALNKHLGSLSKETEWHGSYCAPYIHFVDMPLSSK